MIVFALRIIWSHHILYTEKILNVTLIRTGVIEFFFN